MSFYIDENTRTQELNLADGRVRELEYNKIVYRACDISKGFTDFDYNIQPWAWDYLNKHKEILE